MGDSSIEDKGKNFMFFFSVNKKMLDMKSSVTAEYNLFICFTFTRITQLKEINEDDYYSAFD